MEFHEAEKIIHLLKKEVVPALGCTEPVSVAIATAKAREILNREPTSIEVNVSRNIYKNGMAVGIPGTGKTGLYIAAALGVSGGNPEKGLQVFENIRQKDILRAIKLVDEKKVTVNTVDAADPLYVEGICRNGENYSRVVIKKSHTNIVFIETNGTTIMDSHSEPAVEDNTDDFMSNEVLSVAKIYEFSTSIEFERIKFILDGAKMNKAIAQEGLRGKYGLQVGKKIVENIEKGLLTHGLMTDSMYYAAAAADARMAGSDFPAMSNSGSGNQGITVMLPVVVLAEKLQKNDEELARALVLSNLIAVYIKSYLGVLSALCGVVIAATGASCGMTYLLGGEYKKISYAINNMTGNITGMICDGAKLGCAFKVSTGVAAAVESALLAIDGITVSGLDGIVDDDIEKTIKNLAVIGSKGMHETDKLIIDIMTCK